MIARFLISKKHTGLGSDMATIVGGWYYASRTARTLVIDWRNSRYLLDRSANAFPRLFQPMDQIAGVQILCDDSVAEEKFPKPVVSLHKLEPRRRRLLIRDGADVDASTLVNKNPMHILPSLTAQRTIFSALRLHPDVYHELEVFRRREFGAAKVLGIHVRHGNGEHLGFGRETNLEELKLQIVRNCKRLCEALKKSACLRVKVFLATDSQEVEDTLKSALPNVVTRSKLFHVTGGGPLHRRALGLAGAQDALIEMFLLAHCNALIYTDSWFSYYARVIGHFDFPPMSVLSRSSYARSTKAFESLQ